MSIVQYRCVVIEIHIQCCKRQWNQLYNGCYIMRKNIRSTVNEAPPIALCSPCSARITMTTCLPVGTSEVGIEYGKVPVQFGAHDEILVLNLIEASTYPCAYCCIEAVYVL